MSELAARRAHVISPAPEAEPVPEQPPEGVLDLLSALGVAMCRAGDAADRVTQILDDVATTYAARGVNFFVMPTGVFVRIQVGTSNRVDFAPVVLLPLRLDQVDGLYRLVDDIRLGRADVAVARARLDALLASRPRFGPWPTLVGGAVLTLGLGLMLNPTASALPVYVLLGALVGALRWWADRDSLLASVLPVAAAFAVTWVTFEVLAPLVVGSPLDVVIPSLVTFLPGAALTMAAVELSAGSMVSGSARLVYGLERLLLLTFGIAMGVEVAGFPSLGESSPPLGRWAPWLGVLVFALGHYLASSAPRHTFGWLVLVLYVAYGVQAGVGLVLGSLAASFAAGVVVLPVCYAIQHRRSGPPVPVTFLPAFWLLVPGALGLEGVTKIVGASEAAGMGDFVNALMTIVAIAAGVVVGAGLSERVGRVTSTWRGI